MYFLKLYLISISSILFGYILAEILSETNLIKLIGSKASKIAKLGIHPLLAPIPALYLISPRVAHAHASALLKEGSVGSVDLYIAILASNFPLRVMYIYRYYLPVLLPLLGIVTLYFISLRILFDFLLVSVVLMLGHRKYKYVRIESQDNKTEFNFSKKAFKNGLIKGLKASLNFALRFTPAFLLVVLVMESGILDKITLAISPLLRRLGLDTLSISYITTAIFSPMAACGIAKVMLGCNYPIPKVLASMFLGNALFVLLHESWSRTLPFYSGLYPKGVTLRLLFLQSGLASFYNLFIGMILLKF